MDRQIWSEFGSRPNETRPLAELIKAGIKSANTIPETVDSYGDDEFFEGRLLTEIHKRRERNPNVRRWLLASRRRSGRLACDLCCGHSRSTDPTFEDASFEAHHTRPISMTMARITRLADLSLLCANCHRLVHRAISAKKRWLSIDECQELLVYRPTVTNCVPCPSFQIPMLPYLHRFGGGSHGLFFKVRRSRPAMIPINCTAARDSSSDMVGKKGRP
jgi:5-methylcytosine-specific restriction protein A